MTQVTKIRSVIDEFDSIIPDKQKHLVIESRASHAITSAINILQLIENSFSPTEAEELTKKFFLAIKTGDTNKFTKKIKFLHESQKWKKKV